VELTPRTVWIVDGNYLSKAAKGRFDYLKLKNELETVMGSSIFDAYYFNSSPSPSADLKTNFHIWLASQSPRGPEMVYSKALWGTYFI